MGDERLDICVLMFDLREVFKRVLYFVSDEIKH